MNTKPNAHWTHFEYYRWSDAVGIVRGRERPAAEVQQ